MQNRLERKIYGAGRELLERGVLFTCSVDQIAAQMGVSKVTLYKYFGSRDGLVEELLLRFYRDLLDETKASGVGRQRLEAIFAGEIRKSRLDPRAVQTIVRDGSPEFLEALAALQQDAMLVLNQTFAECVEEGLFRGLSQEDFILVLEVFIAGVVANIERIDPGRVLSIFCAMVLDSR